MSNSLPHLPSTAPLRVVIIGAGVAGCILARKLSTLPDVHVTCLERVERNDHSESGTGLNIGPNAIKMLSTHAPDLADAVAAASFPWQSWRTSLTDGTELFNMPLSQVADNDGVRIRWSELYRVLRDAAADSVRYRCAVTAIGRCANDAARCFVEYDADGQAHRIDDIDLLIAGDGRYSMARAALSGVPKMRQIGVAIYRLLVPDTSHGLIDDYEQWFNGTNRLLAFRVPPGQIYIAGTFPIRPEDDIAEEQKTAAALRACYTPSDRAPSAQAAWMIEALASNVDAIHWARLQETEPAYLEAGTQVLYLGDAAHGMVPTLGQGATQAIEDACVAAELIAARLASGSCDVQEWLQAFDAQRKARIRFVMDFSLEATDTMLPGADPVAGSLHKMHAPFQDKLKRLYREVV
jgi:salicylate hydroxylase